MKLAQIKDAVLIWGVLRREALSFLEEEKLVVVAECRPYLYGLKHNVKIFKEEKIPYVYCTDNMLGILFFKGKIKRTFIFYRKENKNGFLLPAGSLYVYILSKLHNVEVEFLPQGDFSFKGRYDLDASSLGGKRFVEDENLEFVVKAQDELIVKGELSKEE